MKRCIFALIIIIVFINCPKKYSPRVEKIEINYLSSLYKDIFRPLPYLSGLTNDTTLSIAHLHDQPIFVTVLLNKLGFFDFLNSTGIDYLICDPEFLGVDNINYFIIPDQLGYAIQNYQGIRFAIISQPKHELTIEDQVIVTLVQQRSDILWRVDNDILESEPRRMTFYIENRGVSDTTISSISVTPDTVLLAQLHHYQDQLDSIFNIPVVIGQDNLDNYILKRLAEKNEVNVILYPEHIFRETATDSITVVRELISKISFETTFKLKKKITKAEIEELQDSHNYLLWGKIQPTNNLLLAHEYGPCLFDLLALNQD